MIKLVATDIDGTILIPEGKFTLGVIKCIKGLCAKGVKVVLVTGRMHSAAKPIAKELCLDTPIVSYQGGLIRSDEKTIYEKYLTIEQADKIIKWAKEEKIHINLYNDDILYTEQDCYEVQRYCDKNKVGYVVKNFDDVKKDKINKILAIDYGSAERIDKYEKELKTVFPDLYIVKSTPYFLEFSNPEASKYCAVKFLQKYYDVKDDEILTIGDQNNDIELLRAGGVKIAMGNATDELKQVANYVTDSVYDDGFVKAIDEFIVNR